jgi:hypothetical protein
VKQLLPFAKRGREGLHRLGTIGTDVGPLYGTACRAERMCTERSIGMPAENAVIPSERIEKAILLIRGEKVLIDKDLALLYDVSTSVLNRAVSRNIDRFPQDFMFQLTAEEFSDLKYHFGTSSWGGTRKLPRAFTEQGVAMLSSVLKSKRAVRVNIEIMRAFVKLRQLVSSHKDLLQKIEDMEKKYDHQFRVVFEAIKQLMAPPDPSKKRIGFEAKEPKADYARK